MWPSRELRLSRSSTALFLPAFFGWAGRFVDRGWGVLHYLRGLRFNVADLDTDDFATSFAQILDRTR